MRILVCIAVLASLAACSPAGAPSNPREALIGRWGDEGDCIHPLTINSDGTFKTGGGGGTWTLAGARLTLTGAGGAFPVDITWQDNDHIAVTHPDGSVGHSARCP